MMSVTAFWAFSLLLVATQASEPNPGPLTVGSPAPPLKLAAFLRGEPVDRIKPGNIYAIEFSGTQCAPCIRAMPHLSALQKKKPEVTFLSVYGEGPEEVRGHLARHDAEIGYRVALDDDHAMSVTWQQASRIPGIPLVFLVDKGGIIAWIGPPEDLEAALAGLEAGSIDPRLERARLAFGQADHHAALAWQGRRDRSEEAYSRCLALVGERKLSEAIGVAERAALKFPDDAFNFHSAKLYCLASDPKTAEPAVAFAAQLSAMMTYSRLGDLGKQRSGTFDAKIAQALLNGGKGNGDPIITEAAAILIGRAEAGLGLVKDEEERSGLSKYTSQIAASLDVRRKDFTSASGRLMRTLERLRRRSCPVTSAAPREEWEKNRRDQIEEVEDTLRECIKAEEENRRRP